MRDSTAPSRRSLIRPPWPGVATRDENRVARPSSALVRQSPLVHGRFSFQDEVLVVDNGSAVGSRGRDEITSWDCRGVATRPQTQTASRFLVEHRAQPWAVSGPWTIGNHRILADTPV